MKTFKKLITKYCLIILVSSALAQSWFYIVRYFIATNDITSHAYLYAIPNYVHYLVQITVCMLLILDIRKYDIKYKFTPLLGLFYPLLGVAVFLILYVIQQNTIAEEINAIAEKSWTWLNIKNKSSNNEWIFQGKVLLLFKLQKKVGRTVNKINKHSKISI